MHFITTSHVVVLAPRLGPWEEVREPSPDKPGRQRVMARTTVQVLCGRGTTASSFTLWQEESSENMATYTPIAGEVALVTACYEADGRLFRRRTFGYNEEKGTVRVGPDYVFSHTEGIPSCP